MTHQPVEIAAEWISPHGIPSRIKRLHGEMAEPGRALEYLGVQGCCAWRGKERCGVVAAEGEHLTLLLGGTNLTFRVYAAAGPFHVGYKEDGSNQYAHGTLMCEEHSEDFMKDMPRALRRSQEREMKRFNTLCEATGQVL